MINNNINNVDEFLILSQNIRENITKFASFFRKLYFVWNFNLDKNPELKKDVFSSIYDINDLTDSFLLFDNNYRFRKKAEISLFFEGNFPKDMICFKPIEPITFDQAYKTIDIVGTLNVNYQKSAITQKKYYFFNTRYGLKIIFNNLLLNFFDSYIGFKERFSPLPLTKETLDKVIKDLKCYKTDLDLNNCDIPNLLRSIQLASLKFKPYDYRKTYHYFKNIRN